MTNFIDFCKHQHDVECNQKYDKTLPYSFHLNLVAKQVEKFKHLLPKEPIRNNKNMYSSPVSIELIVTYGAFGHDVIEDARMTYNDLEEKMSELNNSIAIKMVQDIIYACTELRGHNRGERHGPEYFQLLKENNLATFVKLCDIIANVSYSLLTNSSMYSKYQKEYSHLYEELYTPEWNDMWDYLHRLLTIRTL